MILYGDCIEKMQELEDNSIDALVSDPPYGLVFMGKDWDNFKPRAFQEFSFQWGEQALRVLKPGAWLLAFSGCRTYHRMVCGLEDAGFEISNMLTWMYGSGFPKSLNISLAINKHLGGKIKRGKMKSAPDGQLYDKRIKIGHPLTDYCYGEDFVEEEDLYEKIPTIKEAKQWDGWFTQLKPALEPIVLAQKPREGTFAENVLKWGVGGLNIDECRIQYQSEGEDPRVYDPDKNIIRVAREQSKHTVSLPAMSMPYAKPKGRYPSNVLLTHHPECKIIGMKEVGSGQFKMNLEIKRKPFADNLPTFNSKNTGFRPENSTCVGNYGVQMVPAYECHPDCPVRLLDEQSGEIKTHHDPNKQYIYKNKSNDRFMCGNWTPENTYNDNGGASRFFYSGKAYKSERNAGMEDLFELKEDTPKKIKKEIKDFLNGKI